MVYIDVFFMKTYFCYYLTATQTPTFGYIKWTPDVSLTGSFIDIVFGQVFRRGMKKNCHQKCGIILSSSVLALQYYPLCHVRSVKMRGWGVKSRYL